MSSVGGRLETIDIGAVTNAEREQALTLTWCTGELVVAVELSRRLERQLGQHWDDVGIRLKLRRALGQLFCLFL